jgi:hypothetical protein
MAGVISLTEFRTMQVAQANYTTAEVASLLGVETWRVQRVFEHGDVSEPPRFGGKRVIPREQIADVAEALRARGWLGKPTGGDAA